VFVPSAGNLKESWQHIFSTNHHWEFPPAFARGMNHQSEVASMRAGEIHIHLHGSGAVRHVALCAPIDKNGAGIIYQSNFIFSGFHAKGQNQADSEHFLRKMDPIPRIFGFVAPRWRKGRQIHSDK
jgi:hypothetical protein